MKIHSDILGMHDFQPLVPEGCYLALMENSDRWMVPVQPVGSRQRKNAFVVRLSGSNKSVMQGLPDKAATYDEWGWFLAEIFALDPDAICGTYKGRQDFNRQTNYAYPLPETVAEKGGV